MIMLTKQFMISVCLKVLASLEMSDSLVTDAEPMEPNLDLRDILFMISNDMLENHTAQFKFLLTDKLPKTKLSKGVSIRQVLTTLEETTLIRQSEPWLLIELLSKIRRNDLIASCFPGLNQTTIDTKLPTGQISPYRLKLFDIAMDLYTFNIVDLMDRFKDIPKSVQEKICTSFDLFTFLEMRRDIHKDDTSKLQSTLRDIGRHDSADDLQKLNGDGIPAGESGHAGAQATNDNSSQQHQSGTPFHSLRGDSTGVGCRIKAKDTHLLAEAALSVGWIGQEGTGFRVGSKYILTAAHVLKNVFGLQLSLIVTKETLQDQLKRKGLDINFKFASPHLADHKPMAFPLENIVAYNDQLDFAIAELAPAGEGIPLPRALIMFYDSGNAETFHLLGHDRANEDQEIDLQCSTITSVAVFKTIFDQLVARCVDKSVLECFNTFGLRQELVQFQGTFKWGGSGSPGVVIRDDKVKVFNMLLCGYLEYEGIPENLKIQEGIRMWSIKEILERENIILCKDIFGRW